MKDILKVLAVGAVGTIVSVVIQSHIPIGPKEWSELQASAEEGCNSALNDRFSKPYCSKVAKCVINKVQKNYDTYAKAAKNWDDIKKITEQCYEEV